MIPEPTRRPFGALFAIASIVVLVVAGALLALVLSRAGGSSSDTTAPGAGVLPTAPASAPPTTARATETQPVASPDSWPVGASGYTVVVTTLAKSDHPRAEAERVAASVQVPGLTARVLDSSEHPRLRPSVWIVYVGRYPTRARAAHVAAQLRAAGVERSIVERLTG